MTGSPCPSSKSARNASQHFPWQHPSLQRHGNTLLGADPPMRSLQHTPRAPTAMRPNGAQQGGSTRTHTGAKGENGLTQNEGKARRFLGPAESTTFVQPSKNRAASSADCRELTNVGSERSQQGKYPVCWRTAEPPAPTCTKQEV